MNGAKNVHESSTNSHAQTLRGSESAAERSNTLILLPYTQQYYCVEQLFRNLFNAKHFISTLANIFFIFLPIIMC